MAKHLRFDIDHKWLMQFENINKIKVLNKCISMRDKRWRMSTEWYKEYLLKFYYDKQFNLIYVKWICIEKEQSYLDIGINRINGLK